ncbi:MAG TPA: class I SAM-dependent rRNA methyltransferase [Anaerolineaceae bacterium]|nr:class I SAM-dependent rRNA methyltransferase [Anaerolineaceae bacterium]
MPEKSLVLKAGREKSVLLRHPWLFSGAIAQVKGEPASGETVSVYSSRMEKLGSAAFSLQSSIAARFWTFDPDEKVDESFLYRKLQSAWQARRELHDDPLTTAYRVLHSESDGLPGLVADRYNEWLVLQFTSAGAEYWREPVIRLLQQASGLSHVYERSDVEVRSLEGLPERTGSLAGGEPPQTLTILENGIRYLVDIRHGHKTGFYLDQRNNRARMRTLAKGKRVLNCFCYTGGFSLSAAAGGAREIISVDSSLDALELGKENMHLNRLETPAEWVEGDVFQVLRKYRDQARTFDLIVLDPPKFAPTAAQVERAARGYKDINLLAFKLLAPGGLLVTFSCSGGVSADLFRKIVAGAALDAGVNAVVLERLSQGEDHPVALNFPEGEYLKGLVLRVN